jgi:hypothetical protein
VISATTCDTGLNHSDAPPLTLDRFLDGNNISWIEFKAEMSGFSDLLRKARSGLTHHPSRQGHRDTEHEFRLCAPTWRT